MLDTEEFEVRDMFKIIDLLNDGEILSQNNWLNELEIVECIESCYFPYNPHYDIVIIK